MKNLLANVEATKHAFRRAFGYTPPHVVQAPGRIELLGHQTNQGLVLAAAINKYVVLAGAPRTDGTLSVFSVLFQDKQTFSRSNLTSQPTDLWVHYVKGLLAELRRRHIAFPGFDLAIGGDLPAGTGLASSAALVIGLAVFIHRLKPFRLAAAASAARPRAGRRDSPPTLTIHEKRALAGLCHRAEVDSVRDDRGMPDQLAVLFAKEAHALEIDCQSLEVAACPLYGDVCWVLCDSGVRQSSIDRAHHEWRAHCDQTARILGLKSLRQLDLKTLQARRAELSLPQYQCAYHVLGENQRVLFATRALREGDFEQFGQYLFQSHQSSRDLMSCPELDLLVDLGRTHPACLGARLTGRGFGGITIHLVRAAQADAYCTSLIHRFQERMGWLPQAQICRIVDGASAVERA